MNNLLASVETRPFNPDEYYARADNELIFEGDDAASAGGVAEEPLVLQHTTEDQGPEIASAHQFIMDQDGRMFTAPRLQATPCPEGMLSMHEDVAVGADDNIPRPSQFHMNEDPAVEGNSVGDIQVQLSPSEFPYESVLKMGPESGIRTPGVPPIGEDGLPIRPCCRVIEGPWMDITHGVPKIGYTKPNGQEVYRVRSIGVTDPRDGKFKVGAEFEIKSQFAKQLPWYDPGCCWVYQLVWASKNAPFGEPPFRRKEDLGKWQFDVIPPNRRYGNRANRGIDVDYYDPTQADGDVYFGRDAPHIAFDSAADATRWFQKNGAVTLKFVTMVFDHCCGGVAGVSSELHVEIVYP